MPPMPQVPPMAKVLTRVGVLSLLLVCGQALAAPGAGPSRQRVRVLGEGEAITSTGEIVRCDSRPATPDLTRRRDARGASRDAARAGPRREPPKVEDGTRTRSVATNFADGTSITREHTVTRDEGTLKHEDTVTLRDGRTMSKEVSWTQDGDTKTRESVVTQADGSSVTHTDSWTRGEGGVQHEGSTIRSDGATSTRQSTLVREGDAIIRDWERTGADGATRSGTTVRTIEDRGAPPRREKGAKPRQASPRQSSPRR